MAGRLAPTVPGGKKWTLERFMLFCTRVASMSSGSSTWLQSDLGDVRKVNGLWYCGPVLWLTRENPDYFFADASSSRTGSHERIKTFTFVIPGYHVAP